MLMVEDIVVMIDKLVLFLWCIMEKISLLYLMKKIQRHYIVHENDEEMNLNY